MAQSSALINANNTELKTPKYLHTAMVSHLGTVVSFAMGLDGKIYYSVLDMSNNKQNAKKDNDKDYWSKVELTGPGATCIYFPSEIVQVGYGVAPNFQIDKYNNQNQKIIQGYNTAGKPLDKDNNELTAQAIQNQTNFFYSSTARLGAKAPFQTLSDGKYIYVFRQSIAGSDSNNQWGDPNKKPESAIVNNTLLVDRFILSGTRLKLSREIRYQRSRHKTEPESRKDTLSAVDVEGNPFYEPTRELAFANHLLADFKLSEQSLDNLKIDKVPDTILEMLKPLTNQEFGSENELLKAVKACIKIELTDIYKKLILKHVNRINGNFSVLLIPGKDSEEQRWQIFTADSQNNKINSFNIKFDESIVFDTTDSEATVNEFIERCGLDTGLIADVQAEIKTAPQTDNQIAATLLGQSAYTGKNIPEDAMSEIVYTIRTGVNKDDFILESTSEWPLIEYDASGTSIKPEYLNNGVLKDDYAFLGPAGVQNPPDKDIKLRPHSSPYIPKHGLSSCYYYQQELGPDGKPMKNKASIMLAMGLEDKQHNRYIGILNFSVSGTGKVSRFTTDDVNMPDINVQALDENPYRNLALLSQVHWQPPQKMRLLNIDPNGLSTSGGVLKFAYTSAAIGESQGYSDAVVATDPYLFDDSLGRVNLYFKGKENNFFVLYFNPTGNKGVTVKNTASQTVSPALSLKPRLDRDMKLNIAANVPNSVNTCTLTMKSQSNDVEKWNSLPKRYSQIVSILNGNAELPLGALEPLGDAGDPKAAYLKPASGQGLFSLRTTTENNLMFQKQGAYDAQLADGSKYSVPLTDLSSCLANNTSLRVAEKSFTISGNVTLKADLFYKPYLSGLVDESGDIDALWEYLKTKNLIIEITGTTDQANLKSAAITGTTASLSALMTDSEITGLSLELLKEGNAADKRARLARLKQSLIDLLLDIAAVRIVTFTVQDTNAQSVDRLEAGLSVTLLYDYQTHFTCAPANLEGTSAPKWEHARSYLFNAEVNYDTTITPVSEINSDFNYTYDINNTIGQWEEWDASLAIELNPTSATNGAALTVTDATTTDATKLKALQPTEKGLSAEAWIKPSQQIDAPASVLYYSNNGKSYSLGIEKDAADASRYRAVATLAGKKYAAKNSFAFQGSTGKEQWRHLAFTHKKYWGYQLASGDTINCGNDDSLNLQDEFSIEVLAQIKGAGTILEKEGEYSLSINTSREVVFNWSGTNYLNNPLPLQAPPKLDAFNQFYKITLIRSRNKPQTEPSKAVYPITGGDQGGDTSSGKKWYEDKTSDEVIKGMAEKQDQMENTLELSQAGILGDPVDSTDDVTPKYYHTLIVTKSDGSSTEWTSIIPIEAPNIESFKNFLMGGANFSGSFAGVRIWNRALSIGDAKKPEIAENKSGLISNWRITEGKGAYLYDNTSENHGVAHGGAWTDSPQTNQPGQFQFYVDGAPQAHDTSTDTSSPGVNQFTLGGIKQSSGFTNHFKGTLEEIRVWSVPRTHEQITDNAFGRLKGEWEQLAANYAFDTPIQNNQVLDSGANSVQLTVQNPAMLQEVLSTAPVATEIPQVRSALTGVLTDYNGTLLCAPGVVEYGDVQKNDDGTINGILKRCYSFIDASGAWSRMTGYKVGNLVSQWYGQAQYDPQVMGFMEGPPPLPAENFPIGSDGDVNTYAYKLNNSATFKQAEEISYNYNTSKEAGWNVGVNHETKIGAGIDTIIAPLGIGISIEGNAGVAAKSNWQTSGKRSESYERGTSTTTQHAFSASLAGYDNGKSGDDRYYKLGNTGYALVKSKTADIYLLRLAHNNALVSISWQPNPDIPEDVNIIPFPINPLYTKQGTLDGKVGEKTDDHYPQAHGAYGQYSYFKPREAYKLKKKIEREKMELRAYFEDSFDVAKTNAHFQAVAVTTGIAQLGLPLLPGSGGAILSSLFNQVLGQVATQVGYNNSDLKDDFAKMGSQRNLVNTYVWTMEGGFYAESTEVAQTQQETFANTTNLSLGGDLGFYIKVEGGPLIEHQTMLSSGSSFTLTKSKTKKSSSSFGLDISVGMPTSPRYKYTGLSLTDGLIKPGTVDAYRFMSFYLEPKGKNFSDLFTKVIDPIWLEQNPDPNAQALRQARGKVDKPKPCWRIMHRVTYVSRILPKFQPEAPPSLEKSMRVSGIESNYMLIKKFEPWLAGITDPGIFFTTIENVINSQLPEFTPYKKQIKTYLALYFNIDQG